MGVEYKIFTKLSFQEQEKIKKLIPGVEKEGIDYRDELKFEEDGIYLCKYRSSNPWEGIEKLKHYLDNQAIPYTIEEL